MPELAGRNPDSKLCLPEVRNACQSGTLTAS